MSEKGDNDKLLSTLNSHHDTLSTQLQSVSLQRDFSSFLLPKPAIKLLETKGGGGDGGTCLQKQTGPWVPSEPRWALSAGQPATFRGEGLQSSLRVKLRPRHHLHAAACPRCSPLMRGCLPSRASHEGSSVSKLDPGPKGDISLILCGIVRRSDPCPGNVKTLSRWVKMSHS